MQWLWIGLGILGALLIVALLRRLSHLDSDSGMPSDDSPPISSEQSDYSTDLPTTPVDDYTPTATTRTYSRTIQMGTSFRTGRILVFIPVLVILLIGAAFALFASTGAERSFGTTEVDIPNFDPDIILNDPDANSGVSFNLSISLANAVVAAEDYWFEDDSYAGLDTAALAAHDFEAEAGISIVRVTATKKHYCIEAEGPNGGFASINNRKYTPLPKRCPI